MGITIEQLNQRCDDLCHRETITYDVQRENALKELLLGKEKYYAYIRGVNDAIEAVKHMLEAEDERDQSPAPAAKTVRWEAD